MPTSFKFYHDAALTQEITALNPITATQEVGGGLGAVDKTVYFGSTVATNKVRAASAPGTDPINISIADANGAGGDPATEVKLALSSGGLATATAGAALSLSHTVTGGVANAIPIYTRRASALVLAGNYTDLSLTTVALDETPV